MNPTDLVLDGTWICESADFDSLIWTIILRRADAAGEITLRLSYLPDWFAVGGLV